jgi:hypothetical protein
VLESLHDAGVQFALLQSSAALRSSDPTGDIDVVVDTPPATGLRRAQSALNSQRISLVSLWPYDVGGTATAFFLTEDGEEGAQVDMLHDPQGLGHYSVRSSELLATTDGDSLFPAVSEPELSVYLFSKRTRKQQPQALEAVRGELSALPKGRLSEVVERLVTSQTLATSILGDAPSQITTKAKYQVGRGQLARIAGRLITPIGYWVHLPGNHQDMAHSMAQRFGRVLVRNSVSRYPSGMAEAWTWFARDIQRIRLRPGLAVSWGEPGRPRRPTPDLTLDNPGSLEEACRTVVAQMAGRYRGV